MCVSHFSHVRPLANPWTVAYQASQSMGFSKQVLLEWVAIFLLQGIFPTRGFNQGVSGTVGGFFTTDPLGNPEHQQGSKYDLICI